MANIPADCETPSNDDSSKVSERSESTHSGSNIDCDEGASEGASEEEGVDEVGEEEDQAEEVSICGSLHKPVATMVDIDLVSGFRVRER